MDSLLEAVREERQKGMESRRHVNSESQKIQRCSKDLWMPYDMKQYLIERLNQKSSPLSTEFAELISGIPTERRPPGQEAHMNESVALPQVLGADELTVNLETVERAPFKSNSASLLCARSSMAEKSPAEGGRYEAMVNQGNGKKVGSSPVLQGLDASKCLDAAAAADTNGAEGIVEPKQPGDNLIKSEAS